METFWTLISALLLAGSWLISIGMLFVVPVNRKPSSATAWLLLIVLVPYLGLLIFLLIGNARLNRRRREQQRTMDQLVAQAVERARQIPRIQPLVEPPVPPAQAHLVQLSTVLGGMPAFAGNTVELLPDYDAIIARLAVEIEQAQSFVHVAFYIIALDATTEPVFAAMERAVQRGVAVRVLLDQIGSRKFPRRREMEQRMRAAGIEWHYMLPLKPLSNQWNRPDLRNHRKIVVVDGKVSYTGSLNLIDRAYNRADDLYYDELVARVTGPVVAQLNAVFATDWFSETSELLRHDDDGMPRLPPPTGTALCQVLPSGSGHDNENNLRHFTALIHAARHSLLIVNPYFVPDDALMLAITSAAQRGVDVTMVNSEAPDQFLVYHAQHSYYEELLRAGVRIQLYRRPVLLHSKFLVIDDAIAMIGSSNLDMRSFQLNLEVSLTVYDADVACALRAIGQTYIEHSGAVDLETWQHRPLRRVLWNNLARLTAALQ